MSVHNNEFRLDIMVNCRLHYNTSASEAIVLKDAVISVTFIAIHYENTPIQIYWKFYHQNIKKIQIKILIFFHISAQNIDCGYPLEPPRRGGSNGYPQSMFWSRNKKNNLYPCKPQFYFIKVGSKGVNIIKACFRDGHIRMRPSALEMLKRDSSQKTKHITPATSTIVFCQLLTI